MLLQETPGIFARPSTKYPGTYDILHVEDGAAVTSLDVYPAVYPVVDIDEDGPVTGLLACAYEHPEGISLTASDVMRLRIEVE